MKIIIETIPGNMQRYKTPGDWFRDKDGTLHIKVSCMGNQDYEVLVAIHELVETLLCEHRGIKEEDIADFDIKFEENRKEGNEDEPGDDDAAMYRAEHLFATGIEKLMASELGVNWNAYSKAVMEA